LTTKDRHLVAKHDDFDRQLVLVSLETQQLEDPQERHIEERQGHGPSWASSPRPENSQVGTADDVVGTHTRRS